MQLVFMDPINGIYFLMMCSEFIRLGTLQLELCFKPGSRELNTTLYKSCLVVLRVDHLPYPFFRSVNTGIMHDTGITKSGVT